MDDRIQEAIDAGKTILKDRWDSLDSDEKKLFVETIKTLAQAEISGEDKDVIAILKVAVNEWKLSGKHELISAAKQIATTILKIGFKAGISAILAA